MRCMQSCMRSAACELCAHIRHIAGTQLSLCPGNPLRIGSYRCMQSCVLVERCAHTGHVAGMQLALCPEEPPLERVSCHRGRRLDCLQARGGESQLVERHIEAHPVQAGQS